MILLNHATSMICAAGFFRFLGIVTLFPFPDGALHIGARIGIALALAQLQLGTELPGAAVSGWQISSDYLQGLISAIPLLVMHHGIRMWGDLFESLRGHQIGLVIDPLSGTEEQPLSILISQTALAVVLGQTTLPLLFVSALGPGRTGNGISDICSLLRGGLQSIISALNALFYLLLPFLVIVLVIEVSLALVARVVPGLSLTSEGYLLRLLAMVAFLLFGTDHLISSMVTLSTLSG